jgi:lysophospholipase L1-like esterase
VPIVLVENIQYPDTFIEESKNRIVREKNDALKMVYKRLVSAGVRDLYYIPAGDLIGTDGEATIDGVHPTDLGFARMAGKFEPLLRKIVSIAKRH